MGTSFFFYSYSLQPTNLPPVAQAVPSDQKAVIGAIVRVDGRSSYDPEGQPLLYSWSFLETPVGSELTDASIEDLEGDGSVVGYTPDVTGYYILQLIVNDGQFDSTPVTARSRVDAALVPTCTDVVPDAKFILRTISDFWTRFFEHKDVLPLVWSSYMQSFGAELLRLYEANNNKSIANIQDEAQRRWLTYDPRVVLDPTQHYIVQGNEQEGLDASTGPFDTTVRALVVGNRELRVISGAVRPSVAGQDVEVLTSNGVPGNTGTYRVQRVAKNLSGYLLSQATPMPTAADDIVATGADLVLNEGFDIVRSPSTNFAVLAGFEPGDYLQVIEGSARGFYEVLGIGLADGLPDDNSLRLDRAVFASVTADFKVHNVVEVRTPEEEGPYTDVVYVPATSCDFDALTTPPITGNAILRGTREIVVGAAKTFEAAVGLSIRILGGQNAGNHYIGDINDSRDGYIITGMFVGVFPQDNVPFQLSAVGTAVGRVVAVDDEAYTVLRAYEDSTYPDPPTGPGEVGIAITDAATVPARLTGLAWRVPVTLVSEETDFERLGVMSGDLVIGRVTRLDTNNFATVYGTVVGADRNRLGFELTRESFAAGDPGDTSDAEIASICSQLGVDGAVLDALGNLVLTGTALQISDVLATEAFNRKYGNLPLRDTSDIDLGVFVVRIQVDALVRNHQLLVDDTVISVPCLREYIRPPIIRDTGEELILLTRDDANITIEQAPVTLVENRDYIIDSDDGFTGRDGAFVVASLSFISARGDFIKRRVRPGDYLDIEYGSNAGTHVIVGVVSNIELHVYRKDTGGPPAADETDVQYTVRRKRAGRYLRFDPEMWTPLEPAPDRLWAETTYIDNASVVESNFGVAVALTAEDLSRRKTTSVTYRSAVEGLLYTWINGPTVYNIRIGAQILLGLPVAVSAGVIVAINNVYSYKPDGTPEFGRILVEDVDPRDGSRTGIVRIYLFPAEPTVGSDFLTGVAENPETGVEYVVGDAVEKFAPLSKGVDVQDYIEDPTWWYGSFSQGGEHAELQKYHKWRLRANAQVVSPEDFALAASYAQDIKPAWTDLDAALTLYLVDEVTVEDDITMGLGAMLYDDVAFSIGAVSKEDDWKGSLLRHLQGHVFGSRLLFDGYDLVFTLGSTSVTSARGGFTSAATMAPNDTFPDALSVRCEDMVRAGDLLYAHEEGVNHGWYAVQSVTDDNTLVLAAVSTLVNDLSGPPMAAIQSQSDVRFVIARRVTNPLATGTGLIGDTMSSQLRLLGANFFSDGITVDDEIIVMPGEGRYVITSVGNPLPGIPWDMVRVRPAPPSGDIPRDWMVVRRYLDPLYSGDDMHCFAGDNVCFSNIVMDQGIADRFTRWDLLTAPLRARLTILTGVNQGEYDVIDSLGPYLVVHPPFPAHSGPEEFTLDLNHPWQPWCEDKVALAVPETTFRAAIYRPRTDVVTVADLQVLGPDYGQCTSATDFAAAGVVAGDYLEIRDDVNPGIYPISLVVGGSVRVGALNLSLMGPSNARILRDDPVFTIHNDEVTVGAVVDLGVLGVLPGDIFEVFNAGGPLPPQVTVVAEVLTPTSFRTTRVLFWGVLAGVLGRILREEVG